MSRKLIEIDSRIILGYSPYEEGYLFATDARAKGLEPHKASTTRGTPCRW